MDKQKAIQKINACLAVYKDPGAQPGEKEAAWERANFIAQKYGLKIVKHARGEGPNFKRNPHYQTFNFDDFMRDFWAHHDELKKYAFTWEPKNANGKRVRDMYVFMDKFSTMHIAYTKGSKNFVISCKNKEKVREFLDKYYKIIDKKTIQFTKILKDSLHVDGRDITGQEASKVFSICFAQVCKNPESEEGKNMFFSLISGESSILKMLYSDVSKIIEEMKAEVNKLG